MIVGNVGDGFIQVKRAAVALRIFLIKIEIDFGKAGQTAFAVFPLVMKCFVRDLDALGICASKDTGSDVAIAKRVRRSLPVTIIGVGPIKSLGTFPLTPAAVRCLFRLPEFVGSGCVLSEGAQRKTGNQQRNYFDRFFHIFIRAPPATPSRKNDGEFSQLCVGHKPDERV